MLIDVREVVRAPSDTVSSATASTTQGLSQQDASMDGADERSARVGFTTPAR